MKQIDPTFKNIKRLFLLSFKNDDDEPTTNSFNKDYISLVEIKYVNALIDNKLFFVQHVRNKQKANKKLVETSRNNYYTTGNLSDYSYQQFL